VIITDEVASSRLARLKQQLLKIYDSNPYVGLLRMKVADITEGGSTISMPIIQEIHGNLFGVAHGGATASLADTAMGVACVTLGKRVVTLDMNINYLYGAMPGNTVTAFAKVIHDGQHTVVVEAELKDEAGRLLAKARGTFFVVGRFDFE
jgi:acyl-CoA thioesterase